MQGIAYMPQNFETDPTPTHNIGTNMDLKADINVVTKESLGSQTRRSDSGFLSTTNNTIYSEEEVLSRQNREVESDTENRSDFSSPGRKYYCPICDTILNSQHDFTLHIRSHNNDSETQIQDRIFVCRICSKILSSASSLDRHVLVHSGERPFTCKYCGDTFTTNGNMHRHMRTHTLKNDYESDGSTDSSTSSKNIEFNNNKIEKHENKRKLEIADCEYKMFRKKPEELPENNQQKLSCPVCKRDDFNSLSILEAHLEDNHPDCPAKCQQCSQVFKNNKCLHIHRATVHASDENGKNIKSSVVGFKDLTFVDFSSEKFPHIARYECEKNLHKASTGLKFQCPKCSRAFPCVGSLQIHENNCFTGLDLSIANESSLDLSKSTKLSESEIRRADFFSRLDLQNNSFQESNQKLQVSESNKLHQRLLETAMKSIDGSKDLADIQSIISMTTNGSLLQHLNSKSNDMPMSYSSNNQESFQEKTEEEETQDIFAVEFRKMKLRGEFPCRLCDAVFPNLRALKGHNRAHLNGNNNGTYRCNMCPHSSIDKAALIRHMRTHNGDRPYECSLCNYAFTTKANCERHLRNRHAKTTREEVKKSIIYHPSEDPTNDDVNKVTGGKEEVKKTNSNYITSGDSNDLITEKIRSITPKMNQSAEMCNLVHETFGKHKHRSSLASINHQIQSWTNSPIKPLHNIDDIIHNENLKSLKEHNKVLNTELSPFLKSQYNFSSNITDTSTPQKHIPKIQVKNIEALNQISDYKEDIDEDETMNFALDLSKKKPNTEDKVKVSHDESPQDLTKKSHSVSSFNVSEILAQQLMKNAPKIDHTNIYASQLAFLRNGFPGLPNLSNWSSFPLNSLLFQTIQPSLLSQDPQDIKRLQRLCGGAMINNFTEGFNYQLPMKDTAHGSLQHINDFNSELNYTDSKYSVPTHKHMEDIKPLALNVDQTFADNIGKVQTTSAQTKAELLHSPNSVKMVIKNGVLMPKQKQRRYRTERPFSCEHCSARFTLRSNMERHIKQQHPQFWSQRQRSSIGNPGRKNPTIMTNLKTNLCDINVPNYDTSKHQDDDSKDNHISDKIKYAILAQHLRTNQSFKNSIGLIKKEEDDDGALIIDEKDDKSAIDLKHRVLEEKLKQFPKLEALLPSRIPRSEETQDLVPVSRLLDNASQQQFKDYFRRDGDEHEVEGVSEEDEEGLVASGSTSEANSGTDENKSESENATVQCPVKKKSAYSLAPNRVSCPYCSRKFPWTSSLRRHILTHTGQKPFKCSHCPLLFTTKSNCDRHLLRKHGNSATTISNDLANSNNTNYLMRNVPERPFKCANCPSSTFSTYSNLKKHISCKHGTQIDDKAQGYEAGSSEDEKQITVDSKNDWDTQISSIKLSATATDSQGNQTNSDLPFKCHLCDGSFSERNDCLDHIKDKHPSEYELLIAKNALDNSTSTPDESNNHDDDDHDLRGKFPDYSNRKVICAFCMRRFWSAEDLRRHMRTHTGERPFSCDICRRRFTLKHSMLRHRKKHNVIYENENLNSDEDNINQNVDKLSRASHKLLEKSDESDGNEGNDLISNLLGIQDRSIIEQVLTASPDDAAKLLGVKNSEQD